MACPPPGVGTCRPSLRHTPFTVFVGAMVTTGGVLGTLCPPGGTMMGPMGPRLGVLAGELWLVAGEETGEDSLLIEDPLKRAREEGVSRGTSKPAYKYLLCWTLGGRLPAGPEPGSISQASN